MNSCTFTLNGLYFNNLKPLRKNVVYVNGVLVPYGEFNQTDYNWGYAGGGPTSLAQGIMKVLNLPEQTYEVLYEKVTRLPKFKSFTRKISLKW